MSNPAAQKFGEKNMEMVRRPAHPQENAGDHTGVLAAVSVFHEMQQFGLKPNVVTFSAILNACSRCASLQEASVLLEQMRFFDSWVYGIAHGLLMGLRDQVWVEALRLFDEIARMDYATGAAFYNALTDVLWHFGQVWTFFALSPILTVVRPCGSGLSSRTVRGLFLDFVAPRDVHVWWPPPN